MASMASPQSSAPDAPIDSQKRQQAEGYRVKAGKPIPLTASQEGEVRELYYANVRAKCADEIRDFAHCAAGRTFTIPIVCRKQRKAMEGCMVSYATRDEEDAAREEWFATLGERRRKKDEDERKRQAVLQQKREWWADYRHPKDPNAPPDADVKKS